MQNHDNIIDSLPRVSVSTEISKKTNNPYTYVTLHWLGYDQRVFLTAEQIALIGIAIEKSQKEKKNLLDD